MIVTARRVQRERSSQRRSGENGEELLFGVPGRTPALQAGVTIASRIRNHKQSKSLHCLWFLIRSAIDRAKRGATLTACYAFFVRLRVFVASFVIWVRSPRPLRNTVISHPPLSIARRSRVRTARDPMSPTTARAGRPSGDRARSSRRQGSAPAAPPPQSPRRSGRLR